MAQPSATKVEQLERTCRADWSHLRRARLAAWETTERLREALHGLDSEDTSVVVSGSLGRGEFTSGSDIDWTLLIDGSADPRHHDLFREVEMRVGPIAAKPPGSEETFGSMVFSHGLIHEIGGKTTPIGTLPGACSCCWNRGQLGVKTLTGGL